MGFCSILPGNFYAFAEEYEGGGNMFSGLPSGRPAVVHAISLNLVEGFP